ncbi:hypothetical protein Slin15195_G126180 [Septoria linicola]|uniref:DUF155 domain-containing protein n=1 Tax=Septoria linicola TaxID=215465 RepID=A0A9Q9B1L6_9PEZI|nr:hypothetical protein Slin14017_G082360 [Septoria linicola]USW59299.1 hypothetical protein Slin15195_G126180 [Septoria linicola]
MASSKAATFIAFRSVVKRSLTTLPSTRSCPVRHLQAPQLHSTTAACARKLPRNHFSSNRVLRQEENAAISGEHKQRKAASKRAANHSLRKVAVAAQSQRNGLIRGSGKTRYVDPHADTKEVTAYCAAEKYNLSRARWELDREGYQADPFGTNLFPQVLHVQTPNYITTDDTTGDEKPRGPGDVFVFPSGCIVTWNVPDKLANNIIERFVPAAAENTGHPDKMEIEDLEYIEDPNRETSRIVGDTILLGTKTAQDADKTSEVDTVLAKIAFSSALARSTKLAVLENALSNYFGTTMSIPLTLSSGKPLKYTQSEILRKTGELLLIRAQLNLYSELTDALPDLFWDSPHELGLEGYYEMVGKALDVGVRIKVLNEKMDYASEIAAVLRERLSEKHTSMLEWTIIWLIVIEVVFGVVHLWWDSEELREKKEDRKVMELLEQYLERELKKESK